MKFADDVKLFRGVTSQQDVERLRNDLASLCKWSEDWLMLFNVEKCKVMHIGLHNTKAEYSINGEVLKSVDEETDLGVIVQNDLKVAKQCSKAVKVANTRVW